MKEYVSITEEDLSVRLASAEKIANQEGIKLHKEKKIGYEYDHFSGEVKIVFVRQTEFSGGKLTHGMLVPLVKRLKKVDKKWHVGIMVYGTKNRKQNVKNEKQVS